MILISTGFVFSVAEVGLRLASQPAKRAEYSFNGMLVPPVRVIPIEPPTNKEMAPNLEVEVNGNLVTWGDISGVKDLDRDLGYTIRKNANSKFGWYPSNNLGARHKTNTPRETTPGLKRMLVFGESFAAAVRVSQEDTWTQILDEKWTNGEVLNFGIEGYSMTQAYLRYEKVKKDVDFDWVLFVFVPNEDLWRDVNLIRNLAEGWKSYTLMPRAKIDGENLQIINGIYSNPEDIYSENKAGLTPELFEHLNKYDDFFISFRHQPTLCGPLLTCRLLLGAIGERMILRNKMRVRALDSEASQISRTIFRKVHLDTQSLQKHFALVFLPSEMELRLKDSRTSMEAQLWRERVELFRQDGYPVMDMWPYLSSLPAGAVDASFDRSHYGPRGNHAIADGLNQEFEKLLSSK